MKIFKSEFIEKLISYFFVGGIAAIVEWITFALSSELLDFHYVTATCTAFILATFVNYVLGKAWTFKESKKFREKEIKEILLIFLVSGIGLVFNVALMYLFVTVMGFDTSVQKIIDKIAATGIVFFWNFLIRRYVIYA